MRLHSDILFTMDDGVEVIGRVLVSDVIQADEDGLMASIAVYFLQGGIDDRHGWLVGEDIKSIIFNYESGMHSHIGLIENDGDFFLDENFGFSLVSRMLFKARYFEHISSIDYEAGYKGLKKKMEENVARRDEFERLMIEEFKANGTNNT